MRQPKKPPANTSRAAVRLRLAAKRFWEHKPDGWSGDPYDVKGRKNNRQLLQAAIDYAEAVKDEKNRERRLAE